jgi:protein TonB
VIKSKSSRALGPGAVISLVLHAVLIFVLLSLVHPTMLIQQMKKTIATVVLQPPPPPPPPPPPKKPPPPPPKTPPKPVPTPPQPQQIITHAAVTTPDVPTVPPPPPAPPKAPVEPQRVVSTGVPTAYYSTIQSVIQSNMQYPVKSMRNNEEGTCNVTFTIGRDGTIEDVKVIEKTGFTALDAECRNVFSRIVKFPPVPENVAPGSTDFVISVPVNFNLTDSQ